MPKSAPVCLQYYKPLIHFLCLHICHICWKTFKRHHRSFFNVTMMTTLHLFKVLVCKMTKYYAHYRGFSKWMACNSGLQILFKKNVYKDTTAVKPTTAKLHVTFYLIPSTCWYGNLRLKHCCPHLKYMLLLNVFAFWFKSFFFLC